MIELSDEQVLSLVKEIVAEEGEDFVYIRPVGGFCKYVHLNSDGFYEPGCIVGHFFSRAGIPLEYLEGWEGKSAGDLASRMEREEMLTVSSKAQNFLDGIQERQDAGESWGKAVTEESDVFM
jgi:hypothetical protein